MNPTDEARVRELIKEALAYIDDDQACKALLFLLEACQVIGSHTARFFE